MELKAAVAASPAGRQLHDLLLSRPDFFVGRCFPLVLAVMKASV